MLDRLKRVGLNNFVVTDRHSSSFNKTSNRLCVEELVDYYRPYFHVTESGINPNHDSQVFVATFLSESSTELKKIRNEIYNRVDPKISPKIQKQVKSCITNIVEYPNAAT
jgi:hypothetical protein